MIEYRPGTITTRRVRVPGAELAAAPTGRVVLGLAALASGAGLGVAITRRLR